MTSLPRLSIPPFSRTTFSKNAEILSKKHTFPKENSTIFGKLSNIFSEHLKKRDVIVDKHFVNCNYLEELVERDKLNYMIVAFYPKHVVYSVKEHNKEPCEVIWRNHFSKEEELYHFINNEEVPIHFLLLCEIRRWNLFYDFHVIVKVEMFASVDQGIGPYFSTFILLKPTSKVPTYFIQKENPMDWEEEAPNNDKHAEVGALSPTFETERILDQEARNKYQSEVHSRLVPDLCLDASETEEVSKNVFTSSSLNSLIEQKDMPKPKKCRIMNKDDILEEGKQERKSEEEKESEYFLCISMRSELKSRLEARELYSDKRYLTEKDNDKDFLPCCYLIEVFTFQYLSRKIKDNCVFEKDEINVYVQNDCFYVLVKSCDSVVDPNEGRDLCCVSTRKNLDNFILAFASAVSNRFCKAMRINHKNHMHKNEVPFFFCQNNEYDYECEMEYMAERMMKMKALFAEEEFEKETDSKDKTDSVMFSDSHMDVVNSSHGNSPMEASENGGESVISGFEEQPCLEKSSIAENLPSVAEKKTESCFSTESTSTREGEPVSEGSEDNPCEQEKSKETLSPIVGKKTRSNYAKKIIISKEDLWSYGLFASFPKLSSTSGEQTEKKRLE